MEEIELGLRTLINKSFDGAAGSLPPHIVQKAAERITVATRKNPALDVDTGSVTQLLEYCDFRELQEILTAKSLWSSFEAAFGTKEGLNGRFGQLAELRNGIRHSRTVDEVTRKDGEAAVLWFGAVLDKTKHQSAGALLAD